MTTYLHGFRLSRKEIAPALFLLLFCRLLQVNGSQYLREGASRNSLPHWLCSFFDETIDHRCGRNETNSTCPHVEPLANDTAVFDLARFASRSWFVQKQQVNGFQPSVEQDFFCLVHTFVPRLGDRLFDYLHYGTRGRVDGPIQEWQAGEDIPEWEAGDDISDSQSRWCAGQDEDGGGLLRVSPCRWGPLLARVGLPMWIIRVAEDYSWSIVSGGEPEDLRQEDPPLCTTRTNVSAEVLLDTSGTGLWLLTRERIAGNETIAEMEDILTEMGIYTEDLYPVLHEGCSYNGTDLIE